MAVVLSEFSPRLRGPHLQEQLEEAASEAFRVAEKLAEKWTPSGAMRSRGDRRGGNDRYLVLRVF